ncbi:MAG TPA: divalent-cation tolerance protein CutA [Gemmatimonadota bacterium]|nr:divalent-cation tolerance protein CutA [Gemmatimonadota bacterium]
MNDPPVRVVLTTCPDAETARRLARTLVEERLAACGNVVPGLVSIYRWQGTVESAEECLLILKTRDDRVPALASRLDEIHPYDVPEMLALPVAAGADSYVRWVLAEASREIPPVEETSGEA